jgi:sialate O-acetylesterase
MVRSTAAPSTLEGLLVSLVLTAGLLSASQAVAEVKVASLIGDHMVVQQGTPVHLWGIADAAESVQATLAGSEGTTRADGKGSWAITLPAMKAGGPYSLTIRGTNALTFEDVWVGEVWVASGQSNMEFPLSRALGADGAVAGGCPGLRLFTVTKATAGQPRSDVDGLWEPCDAAAAEGFSAVAFYFGQELHRILGVPVGLIHSSWGGTPAEAWTPRAALLGEPSLKPMADAFDAALADTAGRAEIDRKVAEWEAKNFHQDTGNTGLGQGFAKAETATADWPKMELPQFWETAGLPIDGAVWFRREVNVPGDWAGRDLAVSLGPLDDLDTTYWNGEPVGATTAETPQYWTVPRRYTVPARLVKAGRNVVAVRVFDHYGNGGFAGTRAQMYVAPQVGGSPLSLAGAWDYKVERELPPAVADFSTRPRSYGADDPESPTVLWNAMIEPLTRFPLAGAIWYQGEANAPRAYQYRTLFPTLIRAWRRAWAEPDLPFLFVQLANFNAVATKPGESDWAELREAQTMTLQVPHTGMAVILDIGEADDIHPRDKKDVGLRLALQALERVYGKDVVASGPTYSSATREGTAMRVRFHDVDGGMISADGGPPKGFAIAGADRKWHWADARVDGDSVVVSSTEVAEPVAVRYGWADNPPNTLRNEAGLPAAPFRTDDWPGITAPR